MSDEELDELLALAAQAPWEQRPWRHAFLPVDPLAAAIRQRQEYARARQEWAWITWVLASPAERAIEEANRRLGAKLQQNVTVWLDEVQAFAGGAHPPAEDLGVVRAVAAAHLPEQAELIAAHRRVRRAIGSAYERGQRAVRVDVSTSLAQALTRQWLTQGWVSFPVERPAQPDSGCGLPMRVTSQLPAGELRVVTKESR